MAKIIWVRPSGSDIEMDADFDVDGLKALGWKKKKGPKPKEETQLDLDQTLNTEQV